MLMFWNERLVFLAVPKTGTTALEGALAPRASLVLRDPAVLKHTPVYRYRRFLEPYFATCGPQDIQTVATVRHPIDWLGSWYRYRLRDELVGHPNSTRGVSFDDFVREFCKDKCAPFAAVGSQAKFLMDKDGRVDVTHLFRYEAQPKLIAFLEARLGMTIQLKQLNVSPTAETPLSPKVEAILRRKRAAEFEVWEAGQG